MVAPEVPSLAHAANVATCTKPSVTCKPVGPRDAFDAATDVAETIPGPATEEVQTGYTAIKQAASSCCCVPARVSVSPDRHGATTPLARHGKFGLVRMLMTQTHA